MDERKFPTAVKLWKYEIERIATKLSLTFPPTIYEIVDRDKMFELSAYYGFPVRYHHWSFGQNYLDMQLSGRLGSIIFEMVINTEPCYGYLLDTNPVMTQKAVMAHVCGHADFFKNNAHFRNAPKGMHNILADNAKRVDVLRAEFGKERVDKFLEACLSLDTMIDLLAPFLDRFPRPAQLSEGQKHKQPERLQVPSSLPPYMDRVLNPPEFIEAQRKKIAEEKQAQIAIERGVKVPAWPTQDVLGFLLLYAPLERWQIEILRIVREESYFFYSGAQTKVMNEGWAAFWEEGIMLQEGAVLDSELCPFARHEAGVLRSRRVGINPYQLGLALWKDVLYRFDTGKHGDVYTECPYTSIKERWNEFAVFKSLTDEYGIGTENFFHAWDEFSTLIQETYEGRGSYPGEYFSPKHSVSEWLLYARAEKELAVLEEQLTQARIAEQEIDAAVAVLVKREGESGATQELLRFKARHDLWLAHDESPEYLWSLDEIAKELERYRKLVALRARFRNGEIASKRIEIPSEWVVWVRKNREPIVLGKGLEKIFEVRRTHNDLAFIDDFFTEEFCREQGFYTVGIEHDRWEPQIDPHHPVDLWVIRNRQFERVKELLKNMFLNIGMPRVELVDANFNNNREVLLRHLHDGRDLDFEELQRVLARLWLVWGAQKPVHLETLETEWPKKRSWWDIWRPRGYPKESPQAIVRKKVRFTYQQTKKNGEKMIKTELE